MSDLELLADYCRHGSHDAFRVLMNRYLRLVYSACLRQLRDRHLAEDATQGVFVLLSQKARQLSCPSLAGWLLTSSRYACANIRRQELRRQRREQVAAMKPQREESGGSDSDLLAELDEGLRHLRSGDREALALRYLQERPLRQVGEALGVSEEAARKRVDRGLERLRQYFIGRGVNAGESPAALAVMLSGPACLPMLPAGQLESLGASILNACHGGGASAVAASTARAIQQGFRLEQMKTAAAVLVAVTSALAGTGWLVLVGLAQHASAAAPTELPVTAPAPVVAPVAPVVAPATEPVVDLSSPEKAVVAFCKALERSDRAALYATLAAKPDRPTTMLDSIFSALLAQNRLILAVGGAFGNGERAQFMFSMSMPRLLQASVAFGVMSATIDGDQARMSVRFPEPVFKLLPADEQADFKTWIDKGLMFTRDEQGWKLDLDRTARPVVSLGSQRGPSVTNPVQTQAALEDITAMLNEVASQVENDQLKSFAEVQREYARLHKEKLGKYAGATWVSIDMVPVVEGK